MSRTKRLIAALSVSALVAGVLSSMAATTAFASSTSTDFESFAVGSPNGQFGWQFTGAYDVAIADPTDFGVTDMGTRALRISNASTSGSFGDWAFSSSNPDEAGEASAVSDGLSGGTRQAHFEAAFNIASADPAAVQPGLQFSLAPDRGDGARMSFLRFNDTSGGIDVTFSEYVEGNPGAAPSCGAGDNFRTRVIASGLDRSTTHSVKITMDFLPGPANDRVEVYIDGALAGAGTSWEDYFRYCEGNPTRTVDSLIFQARSGSGTAPATIGKGFLIDDLSLDSAPIDDPTTSGTWTLQPAQSVTTSTASVDETVYRTRVRPPINANGSSNWPKKRGVIPVQFDLDSATKTTTTETTTTGPAKFESILADNPAGQSVFDTFGTQDNDYAFLKFTPSGDLAFTDLTQLVAAYSFLEGDCQGGSLRWQVTVDQDSDGDGYRDAVHIYYGTPPSFGNGGVGGCTLGSGAGQTGDNLIGHSDVRYDTGQVGGTFYDTYASALSLVGGVRVLRASLVLDSGWVGCPGNLPDPACQDQRVDLTGATANRTGYTPVTPGSSTSTTTSQTPFAPTCELPLAEIKWTKTDPFPSGQINEDAESIQNKDTGQYYRNVDCKYIYNLDVSSLGPEASRQGTYFVYAKIGGQLVSVPAKFDLK